MALELAPFKIRVVSVNPAFTGLVAHLASGEAAFLTGATYLADGGYTVAMAPFVSAAQLTRRRQPRPTVTVGAEGVAPTETLLKSDPAADTR